MSDYIKRDEAVEKLRHLRDKCGNEEMGFALNWGANLVQQMLAADVRENVHGYWIPALDYSNGNEDIECSACGEWFKSIELCGRFGEPNYCPCCGSMNRGNEK